MNRRGFLASMLKAAVACAVLPGATTYARNWKSTESGILIPECKIIGVMNTDLTFGWTIRSLLNEESINNIRIIDEKLLNSI